MNTEYFFIDEFLDSDTLQKITADKPLVETSGYLITPDGSLKEDETNPTLCNRYDDNSIVKSLLPKSNGKLICSNFTFPTLIYSLSNSSYIFP